MSLLCRYLLVVAGVFIMGCQTTTKINPQNQADQRYLSFLAAVETKQAVTNFTTLRTHYTETSFYSPFTRGNAKLLTTAFKQNNYVLCNALSKQHLINHSVSLLGHYTGMVCNAKSDNDDQYLYHEYMLDGLIESIEASGSGLNEASAITIISKEEMVLFIDLKGLNLIDQKLARKDGKVINVVTVQGHPDHPNFTLYFDLTLLDRYHFSKKEQAI